MKEIIIVLPELLEERRKKTDSMNGHRYKLTCLHH